MLRQPFDPIFPDYWDLPGGRLVTPLDSFDPIFELHNLGIIATDLRHRMIVDVPFESNKGLRDLTVFAMTKFVSGDPCTKAVAEFRWMPPNDLKNHLVVPSVVEAIRSMNDCLV